MAGKTARFKSMVCGWWRHPERLSLTGASGPSDLGPTPGKASCEHFWVPSFQSLCECSACFWVWLQQELLICCPGRAWRCLLCGSRIAQEFFIPALEAEWGIVTVFLCHCRVCWSDESRLHELAGKETARLHPWAHRDRGKIHGGSSAGSGGTPSQWRSVNSGSILLSTYGRMHKYLDIDKAIVSSAVYHSAFGVEIKYSMSIITSFKVQTLWFNLRGLTLKLGEWCLYTSLSLSKIIGQTDIINFSVLQIFFPCFSTQWLPELLNP